MRPFPQTLDVISCECLVRGDPGDQLLRDLLADALYESDYGTFRSCRWAAKQTAERELRQRDRDRVQHLIESVGHDATSLRESIRVRTPGCRGTGWRIDLVTGNQAPVIVGDLGYYIEHDGTHIEADHATTPELWHLVYVAGDRRIVVGAGWVIRWILDPLPVLIV